MSQTQSSNSNSNRNRSRRRSGGGGGGGNRNSNSGNRGGNRGGGGGGGNRNSGSGNRGGNRGGGGGGGNRSRRPKRPQPKPPTMWEKFLYTISFGNLGKPDLTRKPRTSQSQSEEKPKFEDGRKPSGQSQKQAKDSKPKREREPKPKRPPELVEVTTERLYVGNLSYDATEADLYDLFSGVGQVKDAEVVVHRHTQRSKGYAFVEMTTVEEAKRAVSVLHDEDYMGRSLCVSGAKSSGPKEGEGEEGEVSDEASEEKKKEAPAEDTPENKDKEDKDSVTASA